jgi:hypothetical protein
MHIDADPGIHSQFERPFHIHSTLLYYIGAVDRCV